MSKHTSVTLTPEQRQQLETLARTGQSPARKLTRARILLLLDRSQNQRPTTDAKVAQALLCHPQTVANVRRRFVAQGLEATLADKPMGSTLPKKITGEVEARLALLACSDAPEGHARWTLRLLSEKVVELGILDAVSHVTIGKTLKKNVIKPWRLATWCIGKPSAQYVSKMEDVLDVYQRPYDADYPVVCFDETRKALHGSPRPDIPAKPGREVRQDYEYARHGSASLLLWYEPLAGKRGVRVAPQHTGVDVAGVLQHLADTVYPNAKKIVLVCDNLATHKAHFLYERFPPDEAHRLQARFEWHFTPEHGSWLNMAECELSVLSRQCLSRRIADIETLGCEASAWERDRNRGAHTADWQFTTADARVKLKHLYPIQNTKS